MQLVVYSVCDILFPLFSSLHFKSSLVTRKHSDLLHKIVFILVLSEQHLFVPRFFSFCVTMK